MTCMNEAFENVLIPTCDELLFKTYGLSLVSKTLKEPVQFTLFRIDQMEMITWLNAVHFR